MKCETTDTILKFVLVALVVLAVIFALQTIFRTRELRSLTQQATLDQNNLMRTQSPCIPIRWHTARKIPAPISRAFFRPRKPNPPRVKIL